MTIDTDDATDDAAAVHSELPDWPPSSTSASSLNELVSLARDYALSHSIVYRPLLLPSSSPNGGGSFHTSVIHAPFALYPSPMPRRLFERALNVQKAYNALYACIAADWQFLEKVVGGNVSKVDEFQGQLWSIAETVRREGVKQVSGCKLETAKWYQDSGRRTVRLSVKQAGLSDRISERTTTASSVAHSVQPGQGQADDRRLSSVTQGRAGQGRAAPRRSESLCRRLAVVLHLSAIRTPSQTKPV